jgi:hypothetical protein
VVRRRLTSGPARVLAVVLVMTVAACGTERDMPESVEMADTASIMRALENPAAGDSMMDTLPGGEMVRGDSAAVEGLLRDKIQR